MANVNIKFNGKDFLLSCDDGQEEHLEELSLHLNKKFNELKNNLVCNYNIPVNVLENFSPSSFDIEGIKHYFDGDVSLLPELINNEALRKASSVFS